MGFFKNLFRKKEYRTVETIDVDEHLRQIMGLVTDTKTALNIPAVSACIDFISGKIAELPIKLYREHDGKTTEITDDVRLSLLNDSTGDLLDPYQMKSAFVRDYLLSGAGYIFPERNNNDFVSLRYVANENVTVTKNYDPIYKVARYQIGTRTFFDDEIMRICRNTSDGVTGIGIIQEHTDILNAAYKQIVYERYLVEHGGNKKGFLQADDRVTQEVVDQVRQRWKELYENNDNNMVVLNSGFKFVESGNTSVEMQLNESKDTNNELICQLFGLSPKVISGTANDEEYISAVKTAIMPIVIAFQTALNKSMLLYAEQSDHYFVLDTKELLKGDILKRYQAYEIALKEGFLQLDEVRYEEDKEPYGLQFIKLGLQDVLFDPKTRTIYTPNTNQTANFGEKPVDNDNQGGIIETRRNDGSHYTKDEHGRFTGSTSSGGGSSGSGGGGSSSGKNSLFHDGNFDDKEITDNTIANVPLVNVFDDETKNQAYQQANAGLLAEAKKYPVGTEVSIVYDENMKHISGHGYVVGEIGKGEVPIDNLNTPYHAFHNHPTGNTFSAEDLAQMARRENMISLSAIGNDAKIHCIIRADNANSGAYHDFIHDMVETPYFLGNRIAYKEIRDLELSMFTNDMKKQLQSEIADFCEQCSKGGEQFGFKYINS